MSQSETRQWGRFDVLGEGPGYKLKLLVVEPGKKLSLQSHAHRDEVWTVVRGTPYCRIDDFVKVLSPGRTFLVPRGRKHQLSNFGNEQALISEVQLGLCEEDDITRYPDDSGPPD